MANEAKTTGNTGAASVNSERMKKASVTRALTAAKLAKLDGNSKYAHSKVMACRRSLEAMADHIADGGHVDSGLLSSIAALDMAIGASLFGG